MVTDAPTLPREGISADAPYSGLPTTGKVLHYDIVDGRTEHSNVPSGCVAALVDGSWQLELAKLAAALAENVPQDNSSREIDPGQSTLFSSDEDCLVCLVFVVEGRLEYHGRSGPGGGIGVIEVELTRIVRSEPFRLRRNDVAAVAAVVAAGSMGL